MGRTAIGDDSETGLSPMAHLRGVAGEVAASPIPDAGAYITHAWSSILAFTQDAMLLSAVYHSLVAITSG